MAGGKLEDLKQQQQASGDIRQWKVMRINDSGNCWMISVPPLAVLSGLVVMGILILFLKKPLFESYATLFPMDLAAGNTVTAFSYGT